MKAFLATLVVLISLLTAARAQQEADEKYIAIYGVLQQADSLAESGEPHLALTSLTEAQAKLQRFQKLYPDWNPGIISYRLDDLAKKIAAVQAQIAAASAPVPTAVPTNGLTGGEATKLSAQDEQLRAQLAAVQAENETLQAKLKEALSAQPAAIDAGELARAQEQIRSLMKENDLMKARETTAPGKSAGLDTNGISQLRRQLTDAFNKYSAEHDARGKTRRGKRGAATEPQAGWRTGFHLA